MEFTLAKQISLMIAFSVEEIEINQLPIFHL